MSLDYSLRKLRAYEGMMGGFCGVGEASPLPSPLQWRTFGLEGRGNPVSPGTLTPALSHPR